jgi:hypothetical protein
MKTPAEIVVNIDKTNVNIIRFSGYVSISEDVPDDMHIVLESNKCSLDMKTCEKYMTFFIRRMCEKFQNKNAIYSAAVESIQPRPVCPIKAGNYTIPRSAIDFSVLNVLSFDGFIWVFKWKLVSFNNGTNLKKILLCLDMELKITKTSKPAT